MKLMIFLGITIGGAIGGGFGNLLDHQSFFSMTNLGGWTILLSMIGSLVGIWAGYRAGQYIG